jgi:pimeloyl-ACP methyl ester carboxylesterase
MDRSVVRLPAGEFSYLEEGEGDPVVFLHALGRSGSDWRQVIQGMSDVWWCLALDQRGHGDSVRPGDYSFESMQEDLSAFIDALGLDKFSLVAHSMGGTVGWLYAEKTPDRLSGLVVEDTPPPSGGHTHPPVPSFPPQPVSYDWEARRQLLRQLNSPDPRWWADIEKVTTPTLVIAGSADNDQLTQLASRLPHSQMVTLETGHWIHESEPKVFTEVVRGFLPR